MNAIAKTDKSRPAKFCLWGLIGSVILGAVLGIVFILRDTWGWFEVQVMLIAATSIVIGAFSLTVPILHRISKLDHRGEDLSSPIEARNLATIDDEIASLQTRIAQLQKVRSGLVSIGPGDPLPTKGTAKVAVLAN